MKHIMIALLITHAYAVELPDSFVPIVSKLLQQSRELNQGYTFSCESDFINKTRVRCSNGVAHCELKKGEDFCFDEFIIKDEGRSANRMMMTFLCTNEEFSPFIPETGLKFGPCLVEDPFENPLNVEGKMVCYCQKKQWSCFNKKL